MKHIRTFLKEKHLHV